MLQKLPKIHIGPRTLKTALAVVIAVALVQEYGSGSPRSVVFGMLGAMGAMQPTTKASLDSCATRTLGVLFGALSGKGAETVAPAERKARKNRKNGRGRRAD